MLRSLFLYLASAEWAKKLIMRLGFARRTAYRFIAGDTLEEALVAVKRLNDRGIGVTLDELARASPTKPEPAQR